MSLIRLTLLSICMLVCHAAEEGVTLKSTSGVKVTKADPADGPVFESKSLGDTMVDASDQIKIE